MSDGKPAKFSSYPGDMAESDAMSIAQDSGYRPLSIPAILAAVLGGLYAVAFLGGFAASFMLGTPWLMPVWSLAWPILVLLVAGWSLVNIRSSDNSLGGESLAIWTLRITSILILCYLAHFAATYFAVRAQGDYFGRQWVSLLTQGEVDRAFLLTLKPPRPAEDANLRTTLEITYNIAPDPSSKGPYSNFKGKEIVRLLQSGGSDTKLTLKSTSSPTYEMGGYLVRLVYHVEIPDGEFDLGLVALGMESPTGAFKGRQWQVLLDGTGMAGKMKPREETRRKLELTLLSAEFAQKWCQAVVTKNWNFAVPAILPGELQEKALKGATQSKYSLELQALAGALLQVEESEDKKLFLRAAQDLFSGKLAKPSDKFWSDPTLKQAILDELKLAFSPMTEYKVPGNVMGGSEWIRVEANIIPKFTREGDKVTFSYECMMLLFPRFQLLGTIVVEGREDSDPSKPVNWHIKEVLVHRAVTMPASMKKGG